MSALSPRRGDTLQKLDRADGLKKSVAVTAQSLRKVEGLVSKAEAMHGQVDRMQRENLSLRQDIEMLKAQKQAEQELIEFRRQNGWTN